MSLNVTLGDGASHSATLVCTNLDGTPATGVSLAYSSDAAGVATVDANSGAITLVGAGTVNITGTGSRGAFAHSDTNQLIVSVDANTGDFTAVLGLA